MKKSSESVIKIYVIHSQLKTVLQGIIFHPSTKLNEVKDFLSKKFGTLPENIKLKLIKSDNTEIPFGINDDEKTLKILDIEKYDTICVTDLNPNVILFQNNIDGLNEKIKESQGLKEKKEGEVKNELFSFNYQADICFNKNDKIANRDYLVNFSVQNDKGVTTYYVDILKNSTIPKPYDENDSIKELCQILLDKC